MASLNSNGSRISGLEDYTILTNNKETTTKVKEHNSIESINLENPSYQSYTRSHSRFPSIFLENDISAWRNRPIKEIEEFEPQQDTYDNNNNNNNNSNKNNSSNTNNENNNRSSKRHHLKISDSISAWKIESSVSTIMKIKNNKKIIIFTIKIFFYIYILIVIYLIYFNINIIFIVIYIINY